eukprot:8688583-Prorocentrum_lima.AAC.1
MTSSLVGSEMCIRDSRIATMGVVLVVAFPPLLPVVGLGGVLPLPLLRFCLLYTSDAADDM